jgi:hypothetical protein
MNVAPAQAEQLSFEAAEYINEEYGFSFKYPKEWQTGSFVIGPVVARCQGIFVVRSRGGGYGPYATVSILPGENDLEVVYLAQDKCFGLDPYSSEKASTKILACNRNTILSDGTIATALKVRRTWSAIGDSEGVVVGAKKGYHWIVLSVWVVPSMVRYKQSLLDEVAHTLVFIHSADGSAVAAEPNVEKQDQSTTTPEKNVSYVSSSQIVDILSDKQATVTWTIKESNYGFEARPDTTVALQSPVAALTVQRVYDAQGDLQFEHLVGPPIPLGQAAEDTVRVHFRYPQGRYVVKQYTMEIDALAEQGLYSGYTLYSGDYWQKVHLEIIAPKGYRISGTQPIEAEKKLVNMREKATLDAEFAKNAVLTAHFSTGIPLLATVGSVLAGGLGSAAWFLVVAPLRRKRKLAGAKTIEDYERKLAQWEKEGYDVRRIREKLKGARKD